MMKNFANQLFDVYDDVHIDKEIKVDKVKSPDM